MRVVSISYEKDKYRHKIAFRESFTEATGSSEDTRTVRTKKIRRYEEARARRRRGAIELKKQSRRRPQINNS